MLNVPSGTPALKWLDSLDLAEKSTFLNFGCFGFPALSEKVFRVLGLGRRHFDSPKLSFE
jgi:hypothetical protein